jgi:mycothiol synthase
MTPELRLLTTDDTAALSSEMARAVEAGDMLASSDPVGAFVMKSFALDPGQFGGAFDGDVLVGFVSPEFKTVVVRPDRRRQGIGRTLVDFADGIVRAKGRPEQLQGVVPGEPIGQAFLEAIGFAYHSTVWDLDLPPDRPVGPPEWPDGLVGRPFAGAPDVEPWVRVFNAAFADHPTPLQLDATFVLAGLDDPDSDNGDVVVVEEAATGEPIGFCATDPGRRNGRVAEHGEIWAVGVRPDRQGRGIGRQLVRAGVERLRAIGVPNVSLSVNGRNAGALGLYESEGFVRSRTRDRWSRPVAAADAVAELRP